MTAPDWTAAWLLIAVMLFTVVHLCGPVWIGWARAGHAARKAARLAATA